MEVEGSSRDDFSDFSRISLRDILGGVVAGKLRLLLILILLQTLHVPFSQIRVYLDPESFRGCQYVASASGGSK